MIRRCSVPDSQEDIHQPLGSFSRRRLVGGAVMAFFSSLVNAKPIAGAMKDRAATVSVPPQSRADRVYAARLKAAQYERDQQRPGLRTNGDEARYADRIGNYSKGLPHDAMGRVLNPAYQTYVDAVTNDDAEMFERIPLGGYLKLSNPRAAHTIDLIGPDAASVELLPPPALDSAEQAGELVELYWHAVLRDVPFNEYPSHPLVAQACRELTAMSDFRGPKEGGRVTPGALFRGISEGGRRGPYISQFLLRDIPLSPIRVPQKIRTAVPGLDFMTTYDEWLAIQNGGLAKVNTFDNAPRLIRNGRDLGEYVHRDFTYQAGICAALMLLKMSAPLDGGVPYHYSITQSGFVTFGPSDILHLVATVANLALKATWYQKWIVHRRARPEEIAGQLHFHLLGEASAPFHPDILQAEAVRIVREQRGSGLLPQAYPEGAPSHPSYPAGHAVIAGACATVLKACFSESWEMPQCVVPVSDGLALKPYSGPPLTVGGELDKLAENIAIGRNFAGVHWRSDGIEGLRLGEAFAIRFLRESKLAANEFFRGFSLTKLDGERITL